VINTCRLIEQAAGYAPAVVSGRRTHTSISRKA